MSDLTARIILSARDLTGRAFRSVRNNISAADTSIGGLKSRLVALLAVYGSFRGFISLITGFADLDTAVRKAAAVTGDFTNAYPAFKAAAEGMGETTQFTSKQAAESLQNLAQAGLSVDDSISSLPEVLKLAAASGADLGTSADILTNIMSQYGFTVDDLATVNDKLVKTFTSSNTSLQDLGYAFGQAGPIAKSAGQDFNDISAILGELANNGYKGEKGGTALRGGLARLLRPARMVREELETLNISVFDNTGKMRPFVDIIQELSDKSASTTQLIKIFGVEAGPAMAALVGKGTEGIRELSDEIKNSGGVAAQVAKDMNSGLGGTLALLDSAFDALTKSMGEGMSAAAISSSNILIDVFGKAKAPLTELATSASEVFSAVLRYRSPLADAGLLLAEIYGVKVVSAWLASAQSYIQNAQAARQAAAAAQQEALAQQQSLRVSAQVAQVRVSTTRALIEEARMQRSLAATEQQRTAAQQQLTLAMQRYRAATTAATQANNALNASLNQGASSSSRLQRGMDAVNGAFSVFLAWDIGRTMGDWLNGFESVRIAGSYLSETVVQIIQGIQGLADGQSFDELKVKFAQVHSDFDEIRQKSTDAAVAQAKRTIASERQKVAAVEESAAQQKLASSSVASSVEKANKRIDNSNKSTVKSFQELADATDTLGISFAELTGSVTETGDAAATAFSKIANSAELSGVQLAKAAEKAVAMAKTKGDIELLFEVFKSGGIEIKKHPALLAAIEQKMNALDGSIGGVSESLKLLNIDLAQLKGEATNTGVAATDAFNDVAHSAGLTKNQIALAAEKTIAFARTKTDINNMESAFRGVGIEISQHPALIAAIQQKIADMGLSLNDIPAKWQNIASATDNASIAAGHYFRDMAKANDELDQALLAEQQQRFENDLARERAAQEAQAAASKPEKPAQPRTEFTAFSAQGSANYAQLDTNGLAALQRLMTHNQQRNTDNRASNEDLVRLALMTQQRDNTSHELAVQRGQAFRDSHPEQSFNQPLTVGQAQAQAKSLPETKPAAAKKIEITLRSDNKKVTGAFNSQKQADDFIEILKTAGSVS